MKYRTVPFICLGIIAVVIWSMYYNANKQAEIDNIPVGKIGRASSELENNYYERSELQDAPQLNKPHQDYYAGEDGRLYERQACGLCNGSGIESNSYGDARICPMCDGKGHQNY